MTIILKSFVYSPLLRCFSSSLLLIDESASSCQKDHPRSLSTGIIPDPFPQVTIGGPSEIRGSTRHNAFSGNGPLCCLRALEFLPGSNRGLGHPLPRMSVHCDCCVHLQLCLLLLLPWAQGGEEFHFTRKESQWVFKEVLILWSCKMAL